QWDAMFEKFKKIQADANAQKEFEKALDESVNEMTKKLDLWIKVKKQEQDALANNYRPGYNHQPGEMNLF
ncbi:MAG: hypothetical protein J7497_09170, partial [Chitinophagaceae bacterium]|nr:hypothetical protein [Chitinophagaceae bacterium]